MTDSSDNQVAPLPAEGPEYISTPDHDPATEAAATEPAPAAAAAGGWGGWGGGPGGPPYGPAHPGYPPFDPDGGWGAPVTGARIRRHRTRPIVAGALVVGTVAASAGIGHVLWPGGASAARAASAPVNSGNAFGSSNAGTGGSGSSTAPDPGSLFGGDQYGGSPFTQSPSDGSSGSTGSAAGSTEGAGGPADVSSIAAKVDPALVDINTTFGYQQASGAGTGIVLTPNGEILTNNHVINGATSISVTDVGNGRTYKANVVGYDSTDDLAVLQLVGASGLQTAKIANSDAVKVGEPVVAVGNAGGAGGTPSAAGGAVTALNQSITAGDELNGTSENLTGLIEVNADVQSGDSGGSLVDSSGRVIGVDSAASSGYSLQSASGQSAQGYAIPINKALSIAKQMVNGQSSSTVHVGPTAFLGVLLSSGSSSGSSGSGYGGFGGSGFGGSGFASGGSGYTGGSDSTGGSGSSAGADVSSVVPGGAAAQAGLAAGDVITSVDGQTVSSPASLSQIIAPDKPGQSITIGWTDSSGQAHTATATLTAGPPA